MCQTALTGCRNSVLAASGEVRPVLTRCALGHRTLRPASGGHRSVVRSFEYLSAHESGGHRTRPVPHNVRPVIPIQAHITRAQGLASGQFFFDSPLCRLRPCPRPLAESATAIRSAKPDVLGAFSPRQTRSGSLPLPPHLAWIQSREDSRIWVSLLIHVLEVFDSMPKRS